MDHLKVIAKYLLIIGVFLLAIFYLEWPRNHDFSVYALGLGVLSNRVRRLSRGGKFFFILAALGAGALLQPVMTSAPHIAISIALVVLVIMVEIDNDISASKTASSET